MILRVQDDTLLTRGQGKGLKLYDEIERDCHAFAVIQKRKSAVIARDWIVEAASPSRADKKAADMIEYHLENINFDKITMDSLDAILKGYSVGETMWATDGKEIFIQDVIPRDQRRFKFDVNRKLRLITPSNMSDGEIMPDRKFIVHTVGAKDGNPYGLGLGSKLFWPVFFKRQDITFWLTFADKFGSPTAVGKYPPNSLEPVIQNLLTSLRGIANDTAIAIPENTTVELLEATRSGSGDFFEKVARYMDEQISEATLGETSTTTGSSGGGMNSNQAGIHNEVRLELVKADSDLYSGTLRNQVIAWLTAYNMPNAKPPRVYRQVEEEEDLNTRADRDEKLFQMGYEMTPEYVTETYGDGYVKISKPNPANPLDPANPILPGADFAEGDEIDFPDQVALDAAIDAIDGNVVDAEMHKLMQPVIDLIKTKSPDDVMQVFAEAYPAMKTADLEDMFARLFFVSEVWGRLNATN
ncbi:MAG: DUF935 domain-containing protein [Methylophilaceae bacterium]